jgi:peptidoglycan/xylan/chitin deacetylase (PgdA/CDA1 family)
VADALRGLARRPAGAALATVLRASERRLGLALCYHRVGDPQGRAGWALVPALGTRLFAEQLRHVRARYRLVRASELAEAVATRRRGQRFPLAVTFDDDLAAHTTAARLLRHLGVPATFFLGGSPGPFFWQALQAALDAGMAVDDPLLPRVSNPTPHRLAEAIRARPRDERAALTGALLERGRPEPGLDEDGIRALVAGGFEIGFHTRDHELLGALDDEALGHALRDGRSRLEEVTGAPLRTIAYPFGIADGRVAAAARAAGFEAGFTLDARPVSELGDPLLMGRYEPSFTTAGQTATELARGLAAAVRTQPAARNAEGPARTRRGRSPVTSGAGPGR